jgi:DNA polymerase I-like protein with 3'-5' exonuclease and polymerase domains
MNTSNAGMIDLHTEYASKLFGVDPSEVTKKQRRVAKAWSYGAGYSAGEIKLGLIVGQYPVRITND